MQVSKSIPKVQVFLSAYNGEKYIQEQVQSILGQKNVEVYLLIRDDGSTDRTRSIIESLRTENPKKIEIIEGENLGYRKSFLRMLSYSKVEMDYFAYADQDDVWQNEKLEKAIQMLLSNPESWLYASSLKITDENLKILNIKCTTDLRQSLGGFFVRTRLAGCTMVFTKQLENIAEKYSNLEIDRDTAPDHDCLLCMLSLLYNRKIAIDMESYILHRRHEGTETSGGQGLLNRIKVEINRLIHRPNSYKYIAKLLLNEAIEVSENNEENIKLIEDISCYDKSFISTIKLCFNREIRCGIRTADILIRCKMLLRRY